MRVILREATHTHDAMQGTRGLIAVTGAKLSQTQRKLAVALEPLIEYLYVTWAVHRLNCVIATFRLSGEHVVSVIAPVPGFFPQHTINHLRRTHFLVTVVALNTTHVLLKHLIDSPAIGVPEHHARRFFLGMEQIEALTDLAMVALLGLFDTLDISRQLLLISPSRAIHAL